MKKINFCLFISTTILFNSCALYTPSAVNTPLFTEKGQVAASFYGATGTNFQVAYSATNNFAILANRFVYKISDQDYNWGPETSPPLPKNDLYLTGGAQMNEIGFGYFKNSNKVVKNPYYKGIFEIFGGYGFGNSTIVTSYSLQNTSSINDRINLKHNFATNKLFLQPSFGIKHKIIEMAFTPRITNIFYGNPTSNIPDSLLVANELKNINGKFYTYFEPTFTARLGYGNIKLQCQVSKSMIIGNNNFDKFNTGASFNAGMIFIFGSKQDKK